LLLEQPAMKYQNKSFKFHYKFLKLASIASFFLICCSATAKETWIQAVGIDENNPGQNFTEFYNSSADFSKACQMKTDRICEKYVNNDLNFARNRLIARGSGFDKTADFKGPITKDNFLSRLREILSKSKAGDKVVISLMNHGGPPKEGQTGKSCVYLNSSECISDEDLKRALSVAPKGVKTVIVADACYSGAFGDLSNRDTCVLSAAGQRHTGSVSSIDLWRAIRTGKIKTLTEYSTKAVGFSENVRLGSQNMAENNCENLREQIAKSFTKEDLRKFVSFFQAQIIDPTCDSLKGSLYLANLNNLSLIFDEVKSKELVSVVCNSTDKEASASCLQLKQMIVNGEVERNLLRDFADSKTLEQLRKDLSDFAVKVNSLNVDLAMAIIKRIAGEYEISSYSSDDQKLILDFTRSFHSTLLKYDETGRALMRRAKELQPHKNIAQEDARALRLCLLQARFETQDPKAVGLPLRQFTTKEIQDAKKCEDSFTF
jgi:hypothetical protein